MKISLVDLDDYILFKTHQNICSGWYAYLLKILNLKSNRTPFKVNRENLRKIFNNYDHPDGIGDLCYIAQTYLDLYSYCDFKKPFRVNESTILKGLKLKLQEFLKGRK